ncbi:MAG: bifunctional phosphoribosyl-AMP cyclohydrolase/phosphoribosyl-ATP diphosphatase HisIE [Dorea sp.]|nr:bifunctional phosphoribosyl-AMP cyclohydrolase/phosphoribosyl-ATP diphosphatase HisIE [Dorea sp.]
MNYKKLIPNIFTRGSKATLWFNDKTIISEDIFALGEEYADLGADELLIFEMSDRDKDHDEALEVIKQMSRAFHIPMSVGGNIRTLEDVKKVLYSGVQRIVFDFNDYSKRSLLRDTYKRFGKEKVAILLDDFDSLFKNLRMIEEYACEIIFRNHVDLSSVENMTNLPCIVISDSLYEKELIDMLSYRAMRGLSGKYISRPHVDLSTFKERCMDEDIQMSALLATMNFDRFKLNQDGLIPVVVQDYKNMEVLMVAYMNEEAYNHTVRTGVMTYWSRSRNELWIKGATSGHFQYVKSMSIDCDNDTILAKVEQIGAACHTGSRSCFYKNLAGKDPEEENPTKIFDEIYEEVQSSINDQGFESYEKFITSKGKDSVLKKYSETLVELLLAAHSNRDGDIRKEIGNSFYHLMLLMVEEGLTWKDIIDEIKQ